MDVILIAVGSWIGAVVATIVGSQVPWMLQQKAVRKEEEKRRKALLALFTWEALHLQDRWVQYRRQGKMNQLSFSRPFEITDSQLVAELLRLEPSDNLAAAIHVIKQLNSDVKTQVIRAQDELSAAPAEPVREGSVSWERNRAFETFQAASAFIDDDWEMACHAIRTILDLATDAGLDTIALKRNYLENEKEYEELVRQKSSKKAG